jgi:hypothetical protein
VAPEDEVAELPLGDVVVEAEPAVLQETVQSFSLVVVVADGLVEGPARIDPTAMGITPSIEHREQGSSLGRARIGAVWQGDVAAVVGDLERLADDRHRLHRRRAIGLGRSPEVAAGVMPTRHFDHMPVWCRTS